LAAWHTPKKRQLVDKARHLIEQQHFLTVFPSMFLEGVACSVSIPSCQCPMHTI
jgi:hypothetical protein